MKKGTLQPLEGDCLFQFILELFIHLSQASRKQLAEIGNTYSDH